MSVGNISLHFQTFILPLIVIIQWDFCLHKESDNSQCSTQRSDLIIISLSGVTWRNNKLRQTQSRRTVATSPRCFKKPGSRCKATWKTLRKCTEGKSCFKRSVWSTGCCQTPCANKNLTRLLQLMAKRMFGNVNWYFLLTHCVDVNKSVYKSTSLTGWRAPAEPHVLDSGRWPPVWSPVYYTDWGPLGPLAAWGETWLLWRARGGLRSEGGSLEVPVLKERNECSNRQMERCKLGLNHCLSGLTDNPEIYKYFCILIYFRQLCCLIFLWKLFIIFQDFRIINRNFKTT